MDSRPRCATGWRAASTEPAGSRWPRCAGRSSAAEALGGARPRAAGDARWAGARALAGDGPARRGRRVRPGGAEARLDPEAVRVRGEPPRRARGARAAPVSASPRSWSRSARRAHSSLDRNGLEHVPARPIDPGVDPTGAGDAFGAAYLVARADGGGPVGAARRACALAADLHLGQHADEGVRPHRRRRLPRRPRGRLGARPGRGRRLRPATRTGVSKPFLPRLVAASGAGSTVVAVVATRPPLAVSHDAGQHVARVRPGSPARARSRPCRPRTPTTCCSRPRSGSTSRPTAAASGARSTSSCPRSKRWPGPI